MFSPGGELWLTHRLFLLDKSQKICYNIIMEDKKMIFIYMLFAFALMAAICYVMLRITGAIK